MGYIEQYKEWCEKFEKAEVEVMDKDFSIIFLRMLMAERQESPLPVELKEALAYNIIDKRANFIKLKINEWAKAFLTVLCESPGMAVMYLYFLQYKQSEEEEEEEEEITIARIAESIFPMGFLTADALNELWIAQKVPDELDNLLDHIGFA